MDTRLKISIIAAVSDNGVVGLNNAIPWEPPKEDLERFKNITTGHSLIMGRKTYESLPPKFRPLPGRKNIILSRQKKFEAHHECRVVDSLEEALAEAFFSCYPFVWPKEHFVIGGAEIYRQALQRATRLYLTRIHKIFHGDAFFPALDLHAWELIRSEPRFPYETGFYYTFQIYERK